MKSELLLICPLFPATMAQLDAAYTVHRYYQAADKEDFVAGGAHGMRGRQCAGPVAGNDAAHRVQR